MKTLNLPQDLIPEGSIITGFRGSISQNTYKPETETNSIDDIDLISVYIAPVDYYIGLNQNPLYIRGNQIIKGKFDVVSYELKHFTKLALRFNPNIIPLLWLAKKHYLKVDPPGQILIDNRNCFSSKRAYKAFTGYANDQLKKMSKNTFSGYMGAKRKALVEKFGFDCKNASHTIRLFKMSIEFLETGRLNVYRDEDREVLLDIKEGKWTLNQVKDCAKGLYEDAKIALKKSDLPEESDDTTINGIFMEIISDYIYEKYQMPQALQKY